MGHILHIDHFGNLITNIKSEDLPQAGQAVVVEVSNQEIRGLSHNYAEGKDLLATIGSSGYLEISKKEGNASVFLSAGVGREVRVREL